MFGVALLLTDCIQPWDRNSNHRGGSERKVSFLFLHLPLPSLSKNSNEMDAFENTFFFLKSFRREGRRRKWVLCTQALLFMHANRSLCFFAGLKNGSASSTLISLKYFNAAISVLPSNTALFQCLASRDPSSRLTYVVP